MPRSGVPVLVRDQRRPVMTQELYEQAESFEIEECPLLRLEGAHEYGRDSTCRECARPRGRAVRDGRE